MAHRSCHRSFYVGIESLNILYAQIWLVELWTNIDIRATIVDESAFTTCVCARQRGCLLALQVYTTSADLVVVKCNFARSGKYYIGSM